MGNLNDFIIKLREIKLAPKNLSLYQTAFTHRSYLNEVKEVTESNERLEFLGDTVLSYLISDFLFQLRTEDQEGDLTNLRSYIIKTDSLAKAAKRLNLGSFLRLSKGEQVSGGRDNPQLLANTYEAVLGAIYIDLGLEATKKFVNQTLKALFESEIRFGPPKDAKSQLQELLQNKTKASPKYKVLQSFGPDHAKIFTVGAFLDGAQIGQGEGPSKQIAEEEAAKQALSKLTKFSA